jgi:hypothetical protein
MTTGLCLVLIECFVLECPYWLNVLYWNVPTDWLVGTGRSQDPYSQGILYWNILTDWQDIFYWIFSTGISLLILEYPYWRDILYWNILEYVTKVLERLESVEVVWSAWRCWKWFKVAKCCTISRCGGMFWSGGMCCEIAQVLEEFEWFGVIFVRKRVKCVKVG